MEGQHFNGLVQARRIRPVHRKHRLTFHRKRRRTCRHTRTVSPHRVDFPVVSQLPRRLRTVPGWQRIRGVPLMKDREVCHKLRTRQIRVEVRQQFTQAQRFINNRLRRKRAHIALHFAQFHLPLKLLAGQIKSLVHGIQLDPTRILHRRVSHQYLANHRHGLQCDLTQHVRTHRHVAPTHHAQVQRSQTSLNHAFSPRLLARQKHHTHAKLLARIEIRAGRFQQKAFRDPRQDPNPVAALAVGGHGSAMRQPRQCRQGLAQNVVTGLAQRGRNKSHTARIVLHARVDQRRIAIGIRHAAAQCCRCGF